MKRDELARLGPSAQAQLARMGIAVVADKPKKGRYTVADKAKRTVDGIEFDSGDEAEMYVYLKRILGTERFKRQVPFELQPAFTDCTGKRQKPITYVADFVLMLPDGEHVCDRKGHLTEMFRVKEKLFLFRHRRPLVRVHTLGQLHDFLQAHGVSVP